MHHENSIRLFACAGRSGGTVPLAQRPVIILANFRSPFPQVGSRKK